MKNEETDLKSDSNPTLSLCMIVKNEENFLPMCLDSVKDYIDEIIIVDTGSTDKTVEIAHSYNAKVYHHPWENSFSKARNYSLKYATGDWILILDADEEIDKEDAHRLKEVIKDPVGNNAHHRADLIFIPVYSKYNNGNNISIANSERIFRNNLGICYEGVVHNTLKYSVPTKAENIKLHHHGYNQDNEQMEKKFARTSALLHEQIKNSPENPVPHHNLAISYLDRNMNDECIEEALEAIRLFELQNSDSQLRLLSHYSVSVAFYRKGDLADAEKYAIKLLSLYPDYLDAHCILSSIYFLRKEYDKCTESTNKYLELLENLNSDPSKALAIPCNTLQNGWLAHTRMAINSFEQNNEDAGMQSLKSAINSADCAWKPYLSIGKHFAEHNSFKMAERFLCDGLKHDPGNKEMQYYLASTYERSENIPEAIAVYSSILDIEPENAEILLRLGSLYLQKHDNTRAKEFFQALLKSGKHLLEAHLGFSKIYISMNDPESCIGSCDELLKLLNLPRNITINSISELSKLYIDVGTTLLNQQNEPLAGFSFEIAVLLDPDALKSIQTEAAESVT